MVNIGKFQTSCSLTTDFKSVFLPLYNACEILCPPSPLQGDSLDRNITPKIGPLGLNLYSPNIKIPYYENLLCAEMGRKQNAYNSHQPVKSFWFSGSPLKQLSPEAITELCFRFSNHFPRSSDATTTRGISVTASELNKTTLALLAGLKFSCVEIHIDASIASNDRSLGKIEAGLVIMSDYPQISLNFKIRYSDHSHPDFMMRLLSLVEGANCQQIELICRHSFHADSAPEILAKKSQLLNINKHFHQLGWVSTGNNLFYAPQHDNRALHQQKKLRMTPWGCLDQAIQTQLGVGVGALSLVDDVYQLNTVDPDIYQKCIKNRRALPATRYQLGDCDNGLVHDVQELICYHQLGTANDRLNNLLPSLVKQGWLKPTDDTFELTDKGLINLNAVAKYLFSHANNGGYNTGDSQKP